jgi:uncharacterized integral membrane protein (TIGR00697 family)
MNELIFLFHVIIISGCAVGTLKLGKEALVAFIAILSVLSNLFITKQIILFGLNSVATDAFAVGAILGLQLLQEYYGREITKRAIVISFFLLLFYALVSWIHLSYVPSLVDSSQPHFVAILKHMPRIALASLTSYLACQLLDYNLYGLLKQIFAGRYLLFRSYVSLITVQLFDTVLFSFLGLYGIIANIGNIIMISFAIKMVVIFISSPFVALSRKIIIRK